MAAAEVLVVVGASRGLGRALAVELVRRGMACTSGSAAVVQQHEQQRPPAITAVLAARDVAGLASTAAAIGKQAGPAQDIATHVVEADMGACSDSAVAAIAAKVQEVLREARGGGLQPWRVTVIYAAGVHEPAAVHSGGDDDGGGGWRFSRADDWSEEDVVRWHRVNVGSAVALFDRLHDCLSVGQTDTQPASETPQERLVFVYLSSQAAEARWWPLGNAVYGPHKSEAERELARTRAVGDKLLCVRYPFVATEMAEKLFAELLLVDKGLHVDPTDLTSPPLAREQVFLPLEQAAADTAALILAPLRTEEGTPQELRFRLVQPHVYSYEPALARQ